ncbi:uncharacterized protein LOC124489998 [Dermatophagoides farinae]|uniref:uncharacterized protein LOC124489998 n=1 Tax=Dermatophagoides farinae TaxID=6954 RepID=UPI003F5FED18
MATTTIDIADPTFLKCFQNHRFSINWISFSPNSQYLCSASDDNNAMLWRLDDEQRTNTCYKFVGHKNSVTSVAMTDSFMISVSKDCTARLWRINQDDVSNCSSDSIQYRCHKSPINSVHINMDGSQFCTASDDQTVKVWSTACANKLLFTLSGGHSNWVRHARYSKLNANLLSSCADDGTICIWDIRSKEAAIRLSSKRRSTHFLGVQWHPTCEYIMSSSSSDCLLRIWDLRYEKTIQFYQLHNGIVSSSDFHPNGNYLISSSIDHTCKIIDLLEGRNLFTLKAHTGPVNCAQFSPDGKYFATAGQDHVILLWQSNLSNIDANEHSDNDDDDDDIRSIGFDPTQQMNNAFDVTTKSSSNTMTSKKMNGNSSDDLLGEHSLKVTNSVSILKCILQQLETMTDSILQIDQRLTQLEEKFQSISFTKN